MMRIALLAAIALVPNAHAQIEGATRIVLADFEDGIAAWHGGTGDKGGVGRPEITTEGAHGSAHALAYHYDFTGTSGTGRVYARLFPGLSLPGRPEQVSFCIRGDGSGRGLTVRLADGMGETWQRSLGKLDFTDWRRIEFPVSTEGAFSWGGPEGESKGKLDAPVRLAEIIIDKSFEGGAPSGVVLLDDVEVLTTLSEGEKLQVDIAAEALVEIGGADSLTLPARILIRNRSGRPKAGRLAWRLVDYRDGRLARGVEHVELGPKGRDEIALQLAITGQGYFELSAVLEVGKQHYRARKAIRVLRASRQAALNPASPIGINGHLADPREMAMMQRGGLKWMRADWSWGACQREPGPFKWARLDSRYESAREHGITLLPILCYGVDWASTKPPGAEGHAGRYMPRLDDWLAYVRAVVARYKDDITHWEVWNEPNIGFWLSSDEEYVTLLKATYLAVKQLDPDAMVLMGGTAGAPTGYIEMLYEAGCKSYMDIINIHPYQYPRMPDDGMVAAVERVREVMARHGDSDKPIWVTEVGYPNHIGPRGVDLRTQADYIARTYINLLSAGVAKVFWYDYQNGSDRYYNEANFGIVFADNRPKPCFHALQTVSDVLGDARFVDRPEAPAGVAAFRFAKPNGREVLCVWSLADRRTVWVSADGELTTTDLMGNARGARAGGVMPIGIDPSPLFLEARTAPTLLAAAPLTVAPESAAVYPTQSIPLRLELQNPTAEPMRLHVRVDVPEGWSVGRFQRRVVLGAEESVAIETDCVSAPGTAYGGYELRFVASGPGLRHSVTVDLELRSPWKVEFAPGREEGRPVIAAYVTNQCPRTLRGSAWWAAALCPPALGSSECAKRRMFRPGERVLIPVSNRWASEATEPPYWPLLLRLDSPDVAVDTRPAKFACAEMKRASERILGEALGAASPGALPLRYEEQVQQIADWGGWADLSGLFQALWSEEELIVRVSVSDRRFQQRGRGAEMWRGDSVQFAIDPEYRHTPGAPYAEYDVGLTPDGPEVFRRTALPCAQAKTQARASIERTPTGVEYVVRVPWDELGVSPKPGLLIGFSLLVNDDDGAGRRGWIEWGGGIGWRKDPSLYLDLTLAE